jgi:hypothetical protein
VFEPVLANRSCIIGRHTIVETLADIHDRDLPNEFRAAYARARERFETRSSEASAND